MVKIVSFRRSGYNLAAKLLWQNAETGLDNYEGLHFSHSHMPAGPFLHIYRPLLPVMLSYYRMRERFGIGECSFTDFLRAPESMLPTSKTCDVQYNGEQRTEAHQHKRSAVPLSLQWLLRNDAWRRAARLHVSYEMVCTEPLRFVHMVSAAFGVPLKMGFKPVLERVGWWASQEAPVEATEQDYVYLQQLQDEYNTGGMQ